MYSRETAHFMVSLVRLSHGTLLVVLSFVQQTYQS
jgi:hypothetical protein